MNIKALGNSPIKTSLESLLHVQGVLEMERQRMIPAPATSGTMVLTQLVSFVKETLYSDTNP